MRNRLFIFAFGFLLALGPLAKAQSVEFTGNAPFFAGKAIRLMAYSDLLVQREVPIDATVIDEKGFFKLVIPELTDTLVQYHILLDRERNGLHPEAGKRYVLTLPTADAGQMGLTADNDTSGYWFEISGFNRWFNDFIADNYERFGKGDYRGLTMRFAEESKAKFGNHPIPYVRQMATYRMADLMVVTRLMGEQKAAETYLFNREVLYDHPDYFGFFKNLYQGKLLEWASHSNGKALYDAVITQPNYDSLFAEVMRRELITGREVGELFIVYGLFDWHYQKSIPKSKLLLLLRQAAARQVHPRLKQITRHFISDLEKLNPGSQAPDLEVLDAMGKSFELAELKGKWAVYLVFFSAQNPGTMAELLGTRAFYKPFEKELRVVGICLDCNFTTLDQLVKKHELKGFYGLANEASLRNFEVVGSAAYFLIDKNGNLVHAPAAPPGLGGFDQVYKLVK